MRRVATVVLVVVTLAALGAPAAPGQRAPSAGFFQEIPDFSGFELVGRFNKWPADKKSLAAICDARRGAIVEATEAGKSALEAVDERTDPVKAARVNNSLGQICLYKGDLDGAVAYFEAGHRIASQHSVAYPELAATALFGLAALGVTHMRRGEVENCALNHNAEMCIFPLSAAARHTAKSGSERAVDYFMRYLERDPKSMEIRWLLNVVHMTLGTYPDKVPKQYLIPMSGIASGDDVGRFADVAPALGIDTAGNAGGAIVDDFDGDGFLDVVVSGVNPCEPMRMYRNNGDGTFADVSARTRLAEQTGGINCVQADYNNDGRLDIYVMRGGWEFPMRNSLLRQNADGTFADVTVESGLFSGEHRTQSAAWADYDNDGWVDLYVAHEHSPSQLFRNKGDGTFVDVSEQAYVGLISFAKGVAWGDYDDNGYPDLYVSNFLEGNFLYRNNGDGTFDEVAVELGVDKPHRSFPTWFWDYDNDGRLDLFVSSYSFAAGEWARPYLGLPADQETIKLYRNTGKGRFTDVSAQVGLDRGVAAMGANFGDLDNDGYLDVYLGTGTPSFAALMPNLMFRNQGGKRFVDVTTSTGTGHLQKGHGVSFADLDNDGDEDVYANLGGAVLSDTYNKALFENPGHGNNWIALKLVGTKSNRAAIGAKIRVTLGAEQRYREVTSGGSFGASPLMQHIGLGKASRIASIEITWPASKTTQLFKDVAVNQFLEIREGAKSFEKRDVKPIAWKRATPHHH
jgi:tetratricopeptide (TPR) repeat protein